MNVKPFDVFLSHNSKDKPTVRQLGRALQERNIQVWLDEWELVPGRPWQDALEEIMQNTQSAAVIIGGDGLGPWEIPEMRACISQFISRGLPVIPVLLPSASSQIQLPPFLSQFTWVDFRGGITIESLDKLEWGITGKKTGSLIQQNNFRPSENNLQEQLQSTLNYYTYISSTKIELLHSQIPKAERNQSFLTAIESTSEEKLVGRLSDVLSFLRKRGEISDYQSSRSAYIEATFSARSANYGWEAGELVMWIGNLIKDFTQIRIALGGSAYHILGNARPQKAVSSSSATPAIELALKQALGLKLERYHERSLEGVSNIVENLNDTAQPFARPCTHKENYFTRGIALAEKEMEISGTPFQEINTVFRVLGRWRSTNVKEFKRGHMFSDHDWYELQPQVDNMDLILGTPLFIALK